MPVSIPDPVTGARAQPIYMSTSYVFEDVDHAAALFNMETPGHIYSRISNPTVGGSGRAAGGTGRRRWRGLHGLRAGGAVCCDLDVDGAGGVISSVLPLSTAAATTCFITRCHGSGSRPPLSIRATRKASAKAITPETRLVFGETLGNPGLEIMDIPAVADIAHENGIPLMIDNTFGTPYLFRPIEHGADIVMHSVTKFLGGHGVAIGGVVVDGGRMDWGASGKFPTLTEPYEGYHGLNFWEEYGPAAFAMRVRGEGLRDFGACLSRRRTPSTFCRASRRCTSACRVMSRTRRRSPNFWTGNEAVEWVSYPTLPSHPDHERAKELLPKGCGAIFSFGVNGGREAGRVFIENLKIFSHLANVGDAKSLVIHPATTTHQQMDAEALKAAGVSEDLVRLSVGMEDVDDLIDDLMGALRAVNGSSRLRE